MIKKIFFATTILLFSINAFSQSSDTISTPVLNNVWNKFASVFSPSNDLSGTWNYENAACMFETDNLLKKAGGAIVATQVAKQFDDYFAKMGIKEGKSSFVFHADSTYSAKLGVARLSGKYSVDPETKQITMSYLRGIGKMRATPIKSGNNLKLMFDANGFLQMMKTMSMFTKNNSIEILAAMADMYDGMLLGFNLKREKEK